MFHDAEWKIIAEEATQEKDPEKFLEIILSLVAAIDKEQSAKAYHFQKQAQAPTAPAA